MRNADSRRLRHAVSQLAGCTDADVAWIMSTLTAAQRERLAALVEEGAVTSGPALDDEHRRIDALLLSVDAPLAARLRHALDMTGGEGRLAVSTRHALATIARDMATRQPAAQPATPSAPTRGLRAFVARLGGAFLR